MLTKEEGGRHTPFFNGYRPQFYFRTTDVTGNIKLPEGVEMVMPGDNIDMEITLITPIACEEGLRFAIREGRTVEAGGLPRENTHCQCPKAILRVSRLQNHGVPQGWKVYVYEGYEIPIYYDPMIGKLIVWATNREYAIERMRRVLHEYKLTGVKNNISYLRAIMDTPDFVEGHYDTGFITKNGEHLQQCIMRTSERAENIAMIAAYMDYLMNLEENRGDATDNRPISKWKEFGLHKGVLRI